LINVSGDLLGTTLGSNVLSARQLRAATVAGQADQILGYQRHRASRAPLPRRIRGRIDDHLTDDAPTRVVGIATRNEKPGERLGYPLRSRFGPMAVEVPQCGAHVTAVIDRPRELTRSPARLVSFIVDPSTVLRLRVPGRRRPDGRSLVKDDASALSGGVWAPL
jgi:hypothetical protein